MSSNKKDYKDYVHNHERRFSKHIGYCIFCHRSIRECDFKCPYCGFHLKEQPRRFPQKPCKVDKIED